MLYVFIGSTQLIIYGLAWLIARLMFPDNSIVPIGMVVVGVVVAVVSMYVMGWL